MLKGNELKIYDRLRDAMKLMEEGRNRDAYKQLLEAMPDIALEALLITAKPNPFSRGIDRASEALISDMAVYISKLLTVPDAIQNGSGNPMRLWRVDFDSPRESWLVWGVNEGNVHDYVRLSMNIQDPITATDVTPTNTKTDRMNIAQRPKYEPGMKVWRITSKPLQLWKVVYAKSVGDCYEYAQNVLGWPNKVEFDLTVREVLKLDDEGVTIVSSGGWQ